MSSRRLITAALVAAASLVAAAPAAAAPLLNEVMFGPPDSATQEYLEIRGAAGESLADTYLVVVDGNSAALGDVRQVFDLSTVTLGTNGFLVLLQAGHPYTPAAAATARVADPGPGWAGLTGFTTDGANQLPNSSTTFLLVQASTAPTTADDIDDDDDRTAGGATYAGWTILDGIGTLDNDDADASYAPVTIRDEDSSGTAAGEFVDVPWTAQYAGRSGLASGSTTADWLASIPEGTAPNLILSTQFTWVPHAVGKALDHVGRTNRAATPNATTAGTANVGDNGAELFGVVLPRGGPTSWWVEYGETTAYGSRTSAQEAGSSVTPIDVRRTVDGLQPGTTYHYRFVAESADGIAFGGDRSFSTTGSLPGPPPPPAPPAPPAPPPIVVPPPTPPALSTASLTKRRFTVRGRTVGITVRCGARARCRGTLVLRARRGRRNVTLGRASFSMPAGTVRTVRVRVNANVRRLMRGRRSLRATVTLDLADRAPRRTTITLLRSRR